MPQSEKTPEQDYVRAESAHAKQENYIPSPNRYFPARIKKQGPFRVPENGIKKELSPDRFFSHRDQGSAL